MSGFGWEGVSSLIYSTKCDPASFATRRDLYYNNTRYREVYKNLCANAGHPTDSMKEIQNQVQNEPVCPKHDGPLLDHEDIFVEKLKKSVTRLLNKVKESNNFTRSGIDFSITHYGSFVSIKITGKNNIYQFSFEDDELKTYFRASNDPEKDELTERTCFESNGKKVKPEGSLSSEDPDRNLYLRKLKILDYLLKQ
jgi:hypothetical protein